MPPAPTTTKKKGTVLGLPLPVVLIGVAGLGYFAYTRYKASQAAAAAATTTATAPVSATTPYSAMYGGGYGPSSVQSSSTTTASTAPVTEIPASTVNPGGVVQLVPPAAPDAQTLASEDPTSSVITSVTSNPAQAQQLANNNTGAVNTATAGTSQAYVNSYDTWAAALQQAFPGGLSNPQTPAQIAWLAANPAPQPTAQAA